MSPPRSILRLGVVVLLAVSCMSNPLPNPYPQPDPSPGLDDRPEIIEIIAPARAAQETLDSLNLGEPNSEQSERNKRTIGILRQLFPNLSQIIDQKIQQIVSYLFRTVGSSLLSGILRGGNNGGSSTASGTSSSSDDNRVSISLPTFGPDSDEDSDEDSDDDDAKPVPSDDPPVANRFGGGDTTTTEGAEATAAVNSDDENQLAGAESQQSEVRVQFTNPDGDSKVAVAEDNNADQDGAASDNGELSLDDVDSTDENRNKRFLSFGLGGGSDSGSGSGGGSGNFLFDIVRQPVESVARAAVQGFRILTGTDSIGLGITATHTAVRTTQPSNNATKALLAGSGGTEQTDEAQNAPSDSGESVGKGDGYTEGVPGPVTRLFIIANRGISNLIQDLILRLAQTSERIVNFKARLITSII